MKKYLTFIVILFVLSCSSEYEKGQELFNQDKYSEAKGYFEMVNEEDDDYDSAQLKLKKIEEIEITKIFEEANDAFSKSNYDVAKIGFLKIKPEHKQYSRAIAFIERIEIIEKEQKAEQEALQKKKDAEKAERIRLANLNKTGMWSVRHYVDDFGEPTKTAYIKNASYIEGSFSNTATQDSDLNVTFLITNSNDISIQLYEYAGNNPVKSYSSDSYKVLMQDKDRKRYNLRAINYSERLSFNKSDSWQIHNVLMKGGTIMFKIIEVDTPTTQYEFTLQNADYYKNAHRIRKESYQ